MTAALSAQLALLTPVLAWTLAHFLWQGALVALALQLVLKACRTARARYAWSMAALMLMALSPLVTFALLRQGVQLALVPSGFPGLAKAEAAHAWERVAVVAWALGVAALAARLGGGLVMVERLRRAARPLPADWAARCRALQLRLATPLSVAFAQSAGVAAPAVAGWLKPMVLIPAAALTHLPAEQLEALILHELAHVRRLDALANLGQTLVETVLFYHPAVWWVSWRARLERENCCDDLAVAAVADPALYVRALDAMEGLRAAPAIAMAANRGPLARRAARILGMASGPERRAYSPAAAMLVMALGATAIAAGVQAQATPAAAPAPALEAQPAVQAAPASPASLTTPATPMREATAATPARIVLAAAAATPAVSAQPLLAPPRLLDTPPAPQPGAMVLAAAAPQTAAASAASVSGVVVPGDKAPPNRIVIHGNGRSAYVIWPKTAWSAGMGGVVELSCNIDVHGLAEACRVDSESPQGRGFGRAALELRPTFKLAPAQGPDGPVNSVMPVEVSFQDGDRGGCPGGVSVGAIAMVNSGSWTAMGLPAPCYFPGDRTDVAPATFLMEPVWTAAPGFADVAAAYPAAGGGQDGYAALHCRVSETGGLSGCGVIQETPKGHGFAEAAMGLAPRFRLAASQAHAPGRKMLVVDVPIRFPAPNSLDATERAVTAPSWLSGFDRNQVQQLFPPQAAAQGLTSGRGVARCTVNSEGYLAGCTAEAAAPAGLGFSEVAVRLASTMRMNLWSLDGAPVQGGVIRVPVRLNLSGSGTTAERPRLGGE